MSCGALCFHCKSCFGLVTCGGCQIVVLPIAYGSHARHELDLSLPPWSRAHCLRLASRPVASWRPVEGDVHSAVSANGTLASVLCAFSSAELSSLHGTSLSREIPPSPRCLKLSQAWRVSASAPASQSLPRWRSREDSQGCFLGFGDGLVWLAA